MNPITFNEPFEALCAAPHLMPAHRRALKSALKSPLVSWEASREPPPQEAYDDAADENGFPKLPFGVFRAEIALHPEDGFRIWYRIVVWSGGGLTLVFSRLTGGEFQDPEHEEVIGSFMAEDLIMTAALDGQRRTGAIYRKSGREAPTDHSWVSQSIIGCLAHLAVDFANPHFHLCRKSPPEGGVPRSVEWRKAREHYVLIHKSHPANQKESAGKRVIDSGPLHRAAHSRRAHYRMLRSPRFKNKVGQRVWVASAWVGPKEWTDHSGQIYRIVDR